MLYYEYILNNFRKLRGRCPYGLACKSVRPFLMLETSFQAAKLLGKGKCKRYFACIYRTQVHITNRVRRNNMSELSIRYNEIKNKLIRSQFAQLNEMQYEAVRQVQGPVLILAGAGSGKTTVLINRIANLIRFGIASQCSTMPGHITEDDVQYLEAFSEGKERDVYRMESLLRVDAPRPWNVLAITFTNKAAGELQNRLADMLGDEGAQVAASTFHSACSRILRREIDVLGYSSSFTIYDSNDSITVIKNIMKELRIDEKQFNPRAILAAISAAKDQMWDNGGTPFFVSDFFGNTVAKVFERYQKALKESNALDFDDIIILTVKLLQQHPDVLQKYRERYQYIMVDEYQDTNNTQYQLVSLLATGHQNLCVVGDDDQSIYKFRGATIENILSFERQFPGAKVIRLEQNYRSTGNILSAANAVIANNTQRKGKNLWTSGETGSPVHFARLSDESQEAAYIARTISEHVLTGGKYSDHAVLYRMNALSNTIEQALINWDIPYRIFGGQRFFERKEIKDMLAYLQVINNSADTLRLERIVNEPKRGIGGATMELVRQISDLQGETPFEVMAKVWEYPMLAKKAAPLMEFAAMINRLSEGAYTQPLDETFDQLLEESGYKSFLLTQGVEGQTRLENIEELKSNIVKYVQETEEPTLSGFLEEVSLFTDLDNFDENADAVILMTLHSAKGLEFPVVFIPGMEEGIFPGMQSMYNPDEVEEERRLSYVGITRARRELHLCCSGQRMLYGRTQRNRQSRFVSEVPAELLEVRDSLSHSRSAAAMQYTAPQPAAAPRSGSRVSNSSAAAKVSAPSAGAALLAGDRVSHKVFGEGMVISVTPMGGDNLIEVAFEKVGTKKIMSNFAKLTKL